MDFLSLQMITAFSFGAIFVVVMIVLAVFFPHPTSFQYNVFRVVLSLAAAGVAAMIPGFIRVELSSDVGLLIRSGGALAVFVIVFFFNPAKLAVKGYVHEKQAIPRPPDHLPSGQPFPPDQREAFIEVWRKLASLDLAGRALWGEASHLTLSEFGNRLDAAEECVGQRAIFFSENDYRSLTNILSAANFYFEGKEGLLNLRDEQERREISNLVAEHKIREQINQNRKWLTEYQAVLGEVRASLHSQMAA